jgi:general secretion pathway protein J
MSARATRGFTLVEALLALAIFATIAVLAYRATAALTDGESRLSAEAQRWRTLESFFTRFEADIRQAVPRSVRVGSTREAPWVGSLGPERQSALIFTRAGAEFSVEPGLAGQRVGYRWREGTVEIAYWPWLDRPCFHWWRTWRNSSSLILAVTARGATAGRAAPTPTCRARCG